MSWLTSRVAALNLARTPAPFLGSLGRAPRGLDDLLAPAVLTGIWPPSTPAGRTIVTTRRTDAALADQLLGDTDSDAASRFGEDAFGFGEELDPFDDFDGR